MISGYLGHHLMQQYMIVKFQLVVLSFLQQTRESVTGLILSLCAASRGNSRVETTVETTYQLSDVGHLSHVVQGVFSRFVQHDEAGGHGAQVPQRLHLWLDVAMAICWSEHHEGS